MSEIEKMYENAGINKNCHANIKFDDCIYSPSDCGNYNYPDFTAEKQLELIKWLINEVDYIAMWHFNNPKKPYDFDLGRHNSGGKTFEDALAQMINNLWQDLAEEEKQQIKEILE